MSVFLSVDPLFEKYPNINPYVYVANNPINAIDPDGRDIVVLSYGAKRRGHKYGHLAMLIGDDKKGWTYFSLDGGKYTYQNEKGKEVVKPGYTVSDKGKYKSVEEFAQSEHNTFKENYYDGKGFENSERDRDGNLLQRYEKAFQISTNDTQDLDMYNTAKDITEKDYTEFFNWCTDNVNGAVEAGGLEGADKTTFWPNSYFNDIENKNSGVRIDNKLKINDVNKGNDAK